MNTKYQIPIVAKMHQKLNYEFTQKFPVTLNAVQVFIAQVFVQKLLDTWIYMQIKMAISLPYYCIPGLPNE